MLVFGKTENVLDGVSGIITAVGAVVVGLTGLAGVILQICTVIQNSRLKKQAEEAAKKLDAAKEQRDVQSKKLEKIDVQTNGANDKLQSELRQKEKEAGQASVIIESLAAKVKAFDPTDTTVKRAEDMLSKTPVPGTPVLPKKP